MLQFDAVFVPTGPPSPPEPVITAVNSTLLHVSWPPHFTLYWYIYSNETSFPLSGVGGCDVLVVNVAISSDIGEGQVGQVMHRRLSYIIRE